MLRENFHYHFVIFLPNFFFYASKVLLSTAPLNF